MFQDVIVKTFYENSFDDAIKYSKTFDPSVPGVTMALTTTVVCVFLVCVPWLLTDCLLCR